jgi:hypothetical protein
VFLSVGLAIFISCALLYYLVAALVCALAVCLCLLLFVPVAVQHIIACLRDGEMPVRVQAATALRYIVATEVQAGKAFLLLCACNCLVVGMSLHVGAEALSQAVLLGEALLQAPCTRVLLTLSPHKSSLYPMCVCVSPVHAVIQPALPHLLECYFTLMTEIGVDDVVAALEAVVHTYTPAPHTVG